MIFDKAFVLSDAQTVTANAASTGYADLGEPYSKDSKYPRMKMFGSMNQLYLVVGISGISGTTPTFQVKLQKSPDHSTWADWMLTETFSADPTDRTKGVVNGDMLIIPVPPTKGERYVRAYYVVGGTSPSFTISAVVSSSPEVLIN